MRSFCADIAFLFFLFFSPRAPALTNSHVKFAKFTHCAIFAGLIYMACCGAFQSLFTEKVFFLKKGSERHGALVFIKEYVQVWWYPD